VPSRHVGRAALDVERSETWGDRFFAACRIADDPARFQKLTLGYGLVPLELELSSVDSCSSA
jgi:hypothetical protein